MALTSLQEALMLATLSPKSARRYLSLPLFGPVIDDFDHWLSEQGYAPGSRHNQLVIVALADGYLRRRASDVSRI
jgi:integrase/recombinase XerD